MRLSRLLALLTSVLMSMAVVPALPAAASSPAGAAVTSTPSRSLAPTGVAIKIKAPKRLQAGRKLRFVASGTTDVRREIGVTYAPKKSRRTCASTYATDDADQWTYQTVEPGAFKVKDRIRAIAFGPGRLKLCAYLIAEDSTAPAVAVASTTVKVLRRRR
jgi:hypothetical protein